MENPVVLRMHNAHVGKAPGAGTEAGAVCGIRPRVSARCTGLTQRQANSYASLIAGILVLGGLAILSAQYSHGLVATSASASLSGAIALRRATGASDTRETAGHVAEAAHAGVANTDGSQRRRDHSGTAILREDETSATHGAATRAKPEAASGLPRAQHRKGIRMRSPHPAAVRPVPTGTSTASAVNPPADASAHQAGHELHQQRRQAVRNGDTGTGPAMQRAPPTGVTAPQPSSPRVAQAPVETLPDQRIQDLRKAHRDTVKSIDEASKTVAAERRQAAPQKPAYAAVWSLDTRDDTYGQVKASTVDVGPPLQRLREVPEMLERAFAFRNCISMSMALQGRVPRLTEEEMLGGTMLDRNALMAHAHELYVATQDLRNQPIMVWNDFGGPFLEQYWINTFARPVRALKRENVTENGVRRVVHRPIEMPYDFELFYPYVPLFIQWTDLTVTAGHDEGIAFILGLKLQQLLRPDVQYITVVQHMHGLYPSRQVIFRTILQNVLVLSAGGYGHVPLPLLSKPLHPIEPSEEVLRGAGKALSFAGRLHGELRQRMMEILDASDVAKAGGTAMYLGDDWISFMQNSSLQLAPRGLGRTSFRLYEVLQLGLIPVYVFDDPWLPYVHANGLANTAMKTSSSDASASPLGFQWPEIAFVVHIADFSDWLAHSLPEILRDKERLSRMRARIREVVPDYFTYEATMRHVRAFLENPVRAAALQPGSTEDYHGLYCVPQPAKPREWPD